MLTTRTRQLFLTIKQSNTPQHRLQQKDMYDADCPDPAYVLNIPQQELRHTTELHLGGHNIARIHPNFQAFLNLETLWLNNNRIERIDNLLPAPCNTEQRSVTDCNRGCLRLKKLYMSNNALTTLEGDLQRLKYIEVLLVANNKLSNMEAVAQQMSHLRFLKQLDLFGNPLCEEENYRLFFIYTLPSLQVLDRRTVTEIERQHAKQQFLPRARRQSKQNCDEQPSATRRVYAFGSTTIATPSPDPSEQRTTPGLSGAAQLVEARVKQIQLKHAAQTKYDENREESQFQEKAHRRELFHKLFGQAPPSKLESHSTSRLFDLEDRTSDVAKLIDLAQERERAETDGRRSELDAKINTMKYLLFPARLGDTFNSNLMAQKATGAEDEQRDYEDVLLANALSQEEQEAIKRVFVGELTHRDAAGLLKLVEGGAALSAAGLQEHFRRIEVATKANKNTSMDLRRSQIALCDWQPFLEMRCDQLYAGGKADMGRGDTAACAAKVRRASVLRDHIALLERTATERTACFCLASELLSTQQPVATGSLFDKRSPSKVPTPKED